jgi:hypothetical protein
MSKDRLLLMEMLGLCGAGKSSLYRQLKQGNPRIHKLPPPPKYYYLLCLPKLTLLWLPLYLVRYRKTRWFSLQEIRLMLYLEAWLPYLKKQSIKHDQIIVLDPGSIYWLSALLEFGPEITRDPWFRSWWNIMYRRWMNALDIIIWLDAPDELLYDRVIRRDEYHEVKNISKDEAIASFGRYRSWYQKIVKQMTSQRDIQLISYTTDKISTNQMAEEILAKINL